MNTVACSSSRPGSPSAPRSRFKLLLLLLTISLTGSCIAALVLPRDITYWQINRPLPSIQLRVTEVRMPLSLGGDGFDIYFANRSDSCLSKCVLKLDGDALDLAHATVNIRFGEFGARGRSDLA